MDYTSASTSRVPEHLQQKPLKRRKKVSFADNNHVMLFEGDSPVAALSSGNFETALEPVGLETDPGEDVEMLDAFLDEDDDSFVHSASSTTNTPTGLQPAWSQVPGTSPNHSGLRLTQSPSHAAAHWQVQPAAQAQQFQPLSWSQPTVQQQASRPQHMMSFVWDIDRRPNAIEAIATPPTSVQPIATPLTAPLHRTHSDDPEINEVFAERNGQVRDLLNWLLDEARLDKPPRHFHQILHAVAQALEERHPADANVVRRMILRHSEPKWQSHRDLFHLLESYLLGVLDPAFFKVLVMMLEEFCRHEQHINRNGQDFSGEKVNHFDPTSPW